MKFRKIYIGLALGAAMLNTSCSNVLEVEPEYVKDGSQIFNNIKDYEFALTGAYSRFLTVGYMGSGSQTASTWATLPDMMSDVLVQTGEDLANWQAQTNWVYETTESNISIAWIAAYRVIAQANLVLRNIDQFAANNPKAVNRIKGQALAIRALAHFDVLRYWGESYGFNDTSKGIPYVETVDSKQTPTRLTVAESWTKIFADLHEAETLLADVDVKINASAKNNIDLNGVKAILSRAYLYAGKYAEAETYATQLINAVPLASKESFPAIWKDASNDEVIWKVSFNAGEGTPSSGVFNGPSNRNRFRPSSTLLGLYDTENDIRYSTYFGVRNASNGTARTALVKFLGRGSATDNLVDWKAFRVAEQYLIRAEARAMQGKLEGANADLNDLRKARIAGYEDANYSASTIQEEIAEERMRELAGEGHRFFDLKRTTKTINRVDPSQLASTARNLGSLHRSWTWPIPQEEMDANTNLTGKQTEGY